MKWIRWYRSRKARFLYYAKEVTLLFLAVFYFIIATNTQTGWLFLLSAFLLGLLVFSWAVGRRSCEELSLSYRWLSEPQKAHPFRIEIRLKNEGASVKQELRVDCPTPAWASEEQDFSWAVPLLEPGQLVVTSFKLTPTQRGEHQLEQLVLSSGAPFGLFTRTKAFQNEDTFLVYPELRKLPTLHARSLLSTALSELVSPSGLGDTRSLRSVRDYRPGDDLRQVHWKASAKRADSSLLIREHYAPAPSRSALFLDTSRCDAGCFERAVSFAASVLWSAHRQGAQTSLYILNSEGEPTRSRHWHEQYAALARVQFQPELPYSEWLQAVRNHLDRSLVQSGWALVSSQGDEDTVETWPEGLSTVFFFQSSEDDPVLPQGPRLVRMRAEETEFHV